MALKRTTTRQKCLAYLSKHKSATAEDFARAIGVTAADIRHHLSALIKEGLVETLREMPPSRRGRPRKTYRLSRIALGDNLPKLTDALLEEWNFSRKEGNEEVFYGRIADRLISSRKPDAQTPISRRLLVCIDLMNSMQYQARWEAHASGPKVILEFCPYLSIIDHHPELCQMDKLMLEKVLGGPIEQLAKLERGTRNIPVCIFEFLG